MLERLGSGRATISELAEPFGMSLTGMKKHIRLLEEAELVTTEKIGRVRRCMLAPYAFEGISTWLQRLDRFAQVVERTKGDTMSTQPTEEAKDSSAEEKAAMRARAKELKAAAEGETAVLAALAEDDAGGSRPRQADPRSSSRRLRPDLVAEDLVRHARVRQRGRQGRRASSATRAKFKERYAMLGFNDSANARRQAPCGRSPTR